MSYLFLVNALAALILSLFIACIFLRRYEHEETKKIAHWFSMLFFVYGFLTIFFCVWFFGSFEYQATEFHFLYTCALLFQTLILFRLFYLFTGQKNVMYWLFFYFAGFFSVYISWSYAPLIFSIISFLLSLILFLNFYSASSTFKGFSYAGIFYCALSAVFQFLLFFQVGDILIFTFISHVIFFVCVCIFFKRITIYPVRNTHNLILEKEHGLILFMRYFVFMVVLINLVFVSTVGFHEFGHVAVSRYFDCQARTIAYESGSYPYSEIICSDLSHKNIIAIAGPLFPFIVALLLLFMGGRYIWPISFLAIGFNFLSAYRDLQELGLSQTLVFASSIVGVVFLFVGVVFLARARMEDRVEFPS